MTETPGNWTTKYKDWFSVITPIVFGISALFVSLASYVVSTSQREIAELQYQVARTRVSPHFDLTERYIIDPKTQKATGRDLIITNHGSPMHNIKISTWELLKIEFDRDPNTPLFREVADYYVVTEMSGEPTGKIAHITGDSDNNIVFASAYFEVMDTKEYQDNPFWSEIVVLVKIQYTNLFGEIQYEYFLEGKKINKYSFELLLSSARKLPMIGMRDISADLIVHTASGAK
ncbi:MAG: hypothetical protein ACFBSD_03170 [Paracoccaceae bacterium]